MQGINPCSCTQFDKNAEKKGGGPFRLWVVYLGSTQTRTLAPSSATWAFTSWLSLAAQARLDGSTMRVWLAPRRLSVSLTLRILKLEGLDLFFRPLLLPGHGHVGRAVDVPRGIAPQKRSCGKNNGRLIEHVAV